MGLNYHSELRFFLGGGLTPYEVHRPTGLFLLVTDFAD